MLKVIVMSRKMHTNKQLSVGDGIQIIAFRAVCIFPLTEWLVQERGVEPLASRAQAARSTSWATPGCGGRYRT